MNTASRMNQVIFMLFSLIFVMGSQPSQISANPAPFQPGDVFAGVGNGLVQHYDSSGNLLETLDTGLGGSTTGCAFDSAGNLYVTAFDANNVIRFQGPSDPHTATPFGSGYSGSPESIVFDANGNIYVGAVNGDNDIRKFDPVGIPGAQFDVAIERRGSDWIDLTRDQRTMFYTSEGRRIFRYDVSGPGLQLTDFAVLPDAGVAFALRLLPPGDGSGGLLVADRSNIKRLNASGAVVQTYDVAGEDTWFSLNLDPDDTSFWAGNYGSGKLYKFDIATDGAPLLTVDTGVGSGRLFGICVFGEKTEALTDTDGDGIPDTIEENGYDAVNRNGNLVHVNLPGADKNRKDIYVYVSWLERLLEHNHRPDQAAIDKVEQTFNNAPVDCDSLGQNCKGINLHVTIAPNGIVETTGNNGNQEIGSVLGACDYNWNEFAIIKDSHFPKEYLPTYHYMIFGHNLPTYSDPRCTGSPSGISRGLGASDFLIGVGDWEASPHLSGTLTEGRATLFMHELGHNLGLGHGGVILSADGQRVGPDGTNYKPNYLSVMNYSFSGGATTGLIRGSSYGLIKRCRIFFFCDGNLDYSRFGSDVLPDLVEANLNETAGLGTRSAPKGTEVKDYGSRYFCNPTSGFTNPRPIEPIDTLVDWNCDRFTELVSVSADINQENGFAETLRTVNEWPHLIYKGGAIGAFGPSVSLPMQTVVDEEITVESMIANSDRDALLISLVVAQDIVEQEETVAYTVRVASNTGTAASGVAVTIILPPGFTYQPGSTTGGTTSDPILIGQTLEYSVPFTVGASEVLSLSFKAKASNMPGIYLSSAQAEGTNAPLVQTGDTTPVQVKSTRAGDCNGDQSITASDITALAFEFFDGDDNNNPAATSGGSYPGNPGCDANGDNHIGASDINCMALLFFNGAGACSRVTTTSASASPVLSIPSQLTVAPTSQVTVPLLLQTNASDVGSLLFSLDYDETQLSFDPADNNQDGIPDAISFNLPAQYMRAVMFNPEDADGELDFMIANFAASPVALADGALLSVALDVGHPSTTTEAAVNFSQAPAASFGSITGLDLSGVTANGSVLIPVPPTLSDTQSTIYLPFISQNR